MRSEAGRASEPALVVSLDVDCSWEETEEIDVVAVDKALALNGFCDGGHLEMGWELNSGGGNGFWPLRDGCCCRNSLCGERGQARCNIACSRRQCSYKPFAIANFGQSCSGNPGTHYRNLILQIFGALKNDVYEGGRYRKAGISCVVEQCLDLMRNGLHPRETEKPARPLIE